MLSGWARWLLWGAGLVMQQLKKIQYVYLQPPPTKDFSDHAFPHSIFMLCFMEVSLGRVGMHWHGLCGVLCLCLCFWLLLLERQLQ